MGQTALSKLPYPEATEQPYVHLDIKDLADKVDDSLFVECTSVTRPPHKPGRRIYETNTGATYVSTGTSWTFIGSWSNEAFGAGGGNLQTHWSSATESASLQIPLEGKYLVSVSHRVDLSVDKPLQLSANLFLDLYAVGPFAVNSAESAVFRDYAGLSTHTIEYTRQVYIGPGVLRSWVKTSEVGGTQSHGSQIISAVRIG